MLSRAAVGAFRARGSPWALRAAVAPPHARLFAKDNKPRHGPRKPFNNSPSPPRTNAPRATGPDLERKTGSGVAAAIGASAATKSGDRSGRPDYSSAQGEFGTRKVRGGNSVPETGGGPGTVKPGASRSTVEPDVSSSQDEIKTADASGGYNARQDTSPSAVDPAIAQTRARPLPDLTQGIPSTLDAESRAGSSELDVTDDAAGSIGGARKGSGDLPKSAYISSADRRRNRLANYMYAAFLLLSVTGSMYLGRNWETEDEEKKHPEAPSGWGLGLFYTRARARLTDYQDYYYQPAFPKLLPDPDPMFERPFTLVLSLEDMLIHSEWTREHGWRMAKRPGVDYFLRYLQQYYELVIFTSVPSHIAEPVIMKLDPFRIVQWPLFREATRYKDGKHVKDLSYLNRDLSKVILIDTDPDHAKLQPENAIVLPRWTGDSKDKELVSLIPFLEYVATMGLSDTRSVLKSFEGKHIAKEFAAREALAREKFEKQLTEERGKGAKLVGKGFMNSLLGIRPGGGMDGSEQSPSEAFEQGKMLQDQIRERGQKQYEALEKEIRENGDKWLKEMAAETKKMTDEQVKGMRSSLAGMFTGGGGGGGRAQT